MPCSGCLALRGVNPNYKKKIKKLLGLKLVLVFIFSPNDSPSKTIKKCFLFHLKSSSFVLFLLPFHTYQIQKDK